MRAAAMKGERSPTGVEESVDDMPDGETTKGEKTKRRRGKRDKTGDKKMPAAPSAATAAAAASVAQLASELKALGIDQPIPDPETLKKHPELAKKFEAYLKRLRKEAPALLKMARPGRPAPTSASAPAAGAACWVCLEEGLDESGQPIRRDCSCRGDSAGYAHLSCISAYAQRKSEELCRKAEASGQLEPVHHPFEKCPNCLQTYRGQLALDLAKECVASTENLPETDLARLLSKLLLARRHGSNQQVETMRRILEEVLATVRAAHKGLFPARATHKDLVSMHFVEADALILFGTTFIGEDSARVLEYLHEGRKIHERIDNKEKVQYVDTLIAQIRPQVEKASTVSTKQGVARAREYRDLKIQKNGKENVDTIVASESLAQCLRLDHKYSAAHGLFAETAAIARRVLGPNDPLTSCIDDALSILKSMKIGATLQLNDGKKEVQLSGLIEDGSKYHGRLDWNAAIFPPSDLILDKGTPVVCHGLKSAMHLNGQPGTVVNFDQERNRHIIAFEDESLGYGKVKGENLRVVFF